MHFLILLAHHFQNTRWIGCGYLYSGFVCGIVYSKYINWLLGFEGNNWSRYSGRRLPLQEWQHNSFTQPKNVDVIFFYFVAINFHFISNDEIRFSFLSSLQSACATAIFGLVILCSIYDVIVRDGRYIRYIQHKSPKINWFYFFAILLQSV